MSRLSDEQWDMIEDSINKKRIANSSHNKRSHCGKGGSVKFPSDYMTKKELKNMNGEVKSYRMNEPMTWKEFNKLSDDLKIVYIRSIREKYNVPNNVLAKAMGIASPTFSTLTRELGLALGKNAGAAGRKWASSEEANKFYEWWGIDIHKEDNKMTKNEVVSMSIMDCNVIHDIPKNGNLVFECNADAALNTLKNILCNAKVCLNVTWDMV